MEPVRGEAAKFYKTRRSDVWMSGMNVYPAPYGFYNDTGERARVPFKEFQRLVDEGKVTRTVGLHLTPTFGDDDFGDDDTGEFCDANGNPAISKTVTIGPTSTVGVGKEDYKYNLHPEGHYLEGVRRFFPGLRLSDIELNQAGIRAKLKNHYDHYDFVIERDPCFPNLVNLVGIDSPGLTASLAIADYVVNELLK